MSHDDASNIIPLNPQIDEIKTLTHQSLTSDFVQENIDRIRYVKQWDKWFVWDGSKWCKDERNATFWDVIKFVGSVSKRIKSSRYEQLASGLSDELPRAMRIKRRREMKAQAQAGAKELESYHTSHAVFQMTKAHTSISTVVEQWDADPYLLNTPGGTVDLRTGTLRAHSHKDYITKSAAVTPRAGEPALWFKFLNRIMKNDQDMIAYLQKVFGYCLFGDPKQHEMYFAYGTGRNGKGATMHTIAGILGDYHSTARIETFTVTSSDRHPTELADLRGARFVTCGETNEGQYWAEAKIKELTGGDPVKARFMRQDFFTYKPQFKLFLAGNHKPKLNNIDAAIEARFRLIPFTVTIPEAERDLDLEDKLKLEWPQILQWCIEGAVAWQRDGHLKPPEAVASATKGYLSQEDAITSWYNECCDANESGFETRDALHKSWAQWAKDNGHAIMSKRELALKLEERSPILGLKSARRSSGMGFIGIELLTPPT